MEGSRGGGPRGPDKNPSMGEAKCVCECVLSRSNSFATPLTVADRALCPWDFPGKKKGAGCHFLLQGIFPTQDRTSISCVSCIAGDSLPLSHWRCPAKLRDSFKTESGQPHPRHPTTFPLRTFTKKCRISVNLLGIIFE